MNKRSSWLHFAIVPLLVLCPTEIGRAQEVFARKAGVPVPAKETGGIGNLISGVDFDGDGESKVISSTTTSMIPVPASSLRIYKYEWSGAKWNSVWSAELNIPLQNSSPTLTYGDSDNDGKMEIIWAP